MVVLQKRSIFFLGIPITAYYHQIMRFCSTSLSSPTRLLQILLFLSPLHLCIITVNHSHPFCPFSYHVSMTQGSSFRSANIPHIFANHEITQLIRSFLPLQNAPISSASPQTRFSRSSFCANMHLYHSIHLSMGPLFCHVFSHNANNSMLTRCGCSHFHISIPRKVT